MDTSGKSESQQPKRDLESSFKKQVTDEAVDGTSLDDLSTTERIAIEATKPRRSIPHARVGMNL